MKVEDLTESLIEDYCVCSETDDGRIFPEFLESSSTNLAWKPESGQFLSIRTTYFHH